MKDPRLPFPEAKKAFVAFLASHGWPTSLLWLSRDRLTGLGRTHWIFRPEDCTSEAASHEFYEAVRRTDSSLRIDAKWRLGDYAVVLVDDYGGDGRHLNFGVAADPVPWPLRIVSSRLVWFLNRTAARICGESAFVASRRMASASPSAV